MFDQALSDHQVVGLSGTSGGAVCALLAWYALREGDPAQAGQLLEEFWADNAATTPFEQLLNATMVMAGDLQQFVATPEISPYDNVFAATGAEEFKRMLRRRVDFERIATPTGEDQPVLLVGAVDVISGEFRAFDSRHDSISADTILASAAIPTLFRSVHLDGGAYWDGLFSQNPPIRELLDARPDEIWVIQINPTRRESEPKTVLEIADRRNELSGNLSLYQELHFIEKIDQMLEAGLLAAGNGYKPIMVRIIELSPSRVPHSLGVTSKLNRDPRFLRDLIAHGRAQADEFLTALGFERAWRERDPGGVMAFCADDVEFESSPPFTARARSVGAERLGAFLDAHLGNIAMDATKKQVAGDSVVWTVRKHTRRAGSRERGEAAITLRAGKVTSLRLGPSPPRA